MSAQDAETTGFQRGLQKFPAELYQIILDLVFTPRPAYRIVRKTKTSAHPRHKPPHLMGVSHDTRKYFAERYYGTSSFVFEEPYDCFSWLGSLPHEHRKLLKNIRYTVPSISIKNGQADWIRQFWRHGLQLRVYKDTADLLNHQTFEELAKELEGQLVLEEWDL